MQTIQKKGENIPNTKLYGRETIGDFVQTSKTPFRQFFMPTFAGTIESIDLGIERFDGKTKGGTAWILRNFDGQHGSILAENLISSYGLEILTAKGSVAKCAAAQGNNGQDTYQKLYPPRMMMDVTNGDIMRPLLLSCISEVNAMRISKTLKPLQLDALSKGATITGESQILRF